MENIDRNFVLELLANEADSQQALVTAFAKKSPTRRGVAGSRAYSLALLVRAIEHGLLEQLAEEADSEGQPTIHDVMTAEELAEADRDAEFAQDAADEERWAGEGAPF